MKNINCITNTNHHHPSFRSYLDCFCTPCTAPKFSGYWVAGRDYKSFYDHVTDPFVISCKHVFYSINYSSSAVVHSEIRADLSCCYIFAILKFLKNHWISHLSQPVKISKRFCERVAVRLSKLRSEYVVWMKNIQLPYYRRVMFEPDHSLVRSASRYPGHPVP